MRSILLVILLLAFFGYSQNETDQIKKTNPYKNYTSQAWELGYVHLNKSTYTVREDLGFQAYIIDQAHLLPSIETINLYCMIKMKG